MRSLTLLILFAAILACYLLAGCGGGDPFPESTYQPVSCDKGACV